MLPFDQFSNGPTSLPFVKLSVEFVWSDKKFEIEEGHHFLNFAETVLAKMLLHDSVQSQVVQTHI